MQLIGNNSTNFRFLLFSFFCLSAFSLIHCGNYVGAICTCQLVQYYLTTFLKWRSNFIKMNTCMCVHVCACYACVSVYVYVYVRVCMCTCVCVCMYILENLRSLLEVWSCVCLFIKSSRKYFEIWTRISTKEIWKIDRKRMYFRFSILCSSLFYLRTIPTLNLLPSNFHFFPAFFHKFFLWEN